MSAAAAQRSVADLRTDSTVPASMVHKRMLDQVFITDWMRGPGDDLATVAAQLPLAHALFGDTAAPYHDLVLMAETIRQAGLVVAAEILELPEDRRQFILREMRVELAPLEANRKGRDTCEMLITTDNQSTVKLGRGGKLAGGLMRVRCSIAGQDSGFCEVVGAWVSDEMYESLRRGKVDADSAAGVPSPIPYAEVERATGKVNPRNCVITPVQAGAEPRTWQGSVIIDRDDPTFFDHPLDHVPGLLLIEAMKQAAVAALCHDEGLDHGEVVPWSLHAKFSRVAEFQPDVTCLAELAADTTSASMRCEQDAKKVCTATIGLARV
jgi:hypothetical protein